MEIGNVEDLEIIFKKIYTELDNLIIEKTIYLQNQLNNIQEYLLKFDDLKFSEKLNYLDTINEVIEYKIKSVEKKENLIKEKINIINKKLTKAFLCNQIVLESFLNHNEQVGNYKEKFNFFKEVLFKIKGKINELEKCREILKVVKYEFNSKHLRNFDFDNLKIFANSFIDIYKSINVKLNEVDLFQKNNSN